MARPIHVLGFSGSFRKASFNSGLIREAIKLAPEGMTITKAEYADIPLFNQDVENNPPEAVTRLREQIRAADALLFAVPEYNYSIPGVLKNMIDWMSRPPTTQPFNGKPVAIFGAGARVGTARAQLHFRQIGVFLNMYIVNKPEVIVPLASEKFDAEGNLKDDLFRPMISDLLKSLAELTHKLTPG